MRSGTINVPDMGRCESDGDCSGEHSNYCKAWYLRGGGENAIGIYYMGDFKGPFCGCVEQTCTWFKQ
jgi:hypothetical protein